MAWRRGAYSHTSDGNVFLSDKEKHKADQIKEEIPPPTRLVIQNHHEQLARIAPENEMRAGGEGG